MVAIAIPTRLTAPLVRPRLLGADVVTVVASEVVTRTEAKSHLRVTSALEDTLIDDLIAAARALVEQHTGRAIGTQVRRVRWRLRPGAGLPVDLYYPPVQALTGVSTCYQGTESAEASVGANFFASRGDRPRLQFKDAASGFTEDDVDEVWATYRCGYTADGADDEDSNATEVVPAALKQAILVTVADLFFHRTSVATGTNVTALPTAAKALAAPYVII